MIATVLLLTLSMTSAPETTQSSSASPTVVFVCEHGAAKSLIATLIFFTIFEIGLRGAYVARNATVRSIPLPYALGDEYGPIPPWLDRLLILVPDNALIWISLGDLQHRAGRLDEATASF